MSCPSPASRALAVSGTIDNVMFIHSNVTAVTGTAAGVGVVVKPAMSEIALCRTLVGTPTGAAASTPLS